MKVRRILLVDSEPNNIRILKNNFSQANYVVDHALTDSEALDMLKQNPCDLVLSEVSGPGIDGYRLLERIQRNSAISHIPVIFLTHKSDVWHRVKSFKLGAKDYIVKPMHVREVMARVNMVLSRIERRNEEESIASRKFVGRLEDLSVSDLIQAFGLERKTGVLRAYNINGLSGQLFFKNGVVVNAVAGPLKAEEAVYKMMGWQKGRFSMFFCNVDVDDEIGVSNMGLLLQGAKRMEEREQLLKELPPLESVVVTTSNFKKILEKQELAPDLENFLNLFDGERSLGRIVDESDYDEITALKRILKLYRLGFLHVLRGFPKPDKKEEEALEPVSEAELKKEEESFSAFISQDTALSVREDMETESLLADEEPASAEEMPPSQEQETPLGYAPLLHQEAVLEPEKVQPEAEPEGEPEEMLEPVEQVEPEPEAVAAEPEPEKHPADSLLEYELEEETEKLKETVAEEALTTEEVLAGEPESEPVPAKEEAEAEKEKQAQNLFAKAKGSVVVLSRKDEAREQIIKALTDGMLNRTPAPAPGLSDIYVGTAEFKGGHLINIISLSVEKEFAPLLDYFSSGIIGCIILIDSLDIDWHYYSYLLTIIRDKLNVPVLVAFYQVDTKVKASEIKAIKSKLSLQVNEEIKLVEKLDSDSSRLLVYNVFKLFNQKSKASAKDQVRALEQS